MGNETGLRRYSPRQVSNTLSGASIELDVTTTGLDLAKLGGKWTVWVAGAAGGTFGVELKHPNGTYTTHLVGGDPTAAMHVDLAPIAGVRISFVGVSGLQTAYISGEVRV